MPLKNYEAIQLTPQYWAISVTDSPYDFFIHGNVLSFWSIGSLHTLDRYLPPGAWQFLFTTKGATEEQAASVVQVMSNGRISGKPQYRRYDRDIIKDTPAKCWTRDSRHSMETLLESKGCDPKNNYALLKRNEDANT